VTCREIDELIASSVAGAALPPQAQAHIANCESCQRIMAALDAAGGVEQLTSRRLEEIKAQTRANLTPVKPLAPTGVFVLWFLLIAAMAVDAGVAHFGTAGWEALGALRRIVVFGVLTASFGLLATMLARQIVPGSWVILRPPLAVAAALAMLTATFAILFTVHPEPNFVGTGLVCLSIGIECALSVALISLLVLRRGLVLNPIAAGALTGLMAGIASLALLEVFCPNPNKYHILAWHLGSAVASTVSAAGVGWVVARFRS
jgi:Negative regulator of sigma F